MSGSLGEAIAACGSAGSQQLAQERGRARVVVGQEDQLGMSETQEPPSGSQPGAQGSI